MANAHDAEHKHDDDETPSIVAVFGSKAEAQSAVTALHKAHFKDTWLGTTSLAETNRGEAAVTVESDSFASGAQNLVEALVAHGVLGDTARSFESAIEPGDALVTVGPKDKDPAEARAILAGHGGNFVRQFQNDLI
jgi:hypothetical protein